MTQPVMSAFQVPMPNAEMEQPRLSISAAGCRVIIQPTAGSDWVSGAYSSPSGDISLSVLPEPNGARIQLGTDPAQWLGLFRGVPELRLSLNTARPFELSIDLAAGEMRAELGGLPLTGLSVSLGAGALQLSCGQPNPRSGGSMKLSVGAGAITASGLLNLHFTDMRVEGAAAGVQLNLAGSLTQDSQLAIATALAGVDVAIPGSVAAEVTWTTLLGHPDADAGFTRNGGVYSTGPALTGQQPLLRIRSEAALGGLRLRTLAEPALQLAA